MGGMCVGSGAVVLLQPGCPRAGCKVLRRLGSMILSLIDVDFQVFSFSIYRENIKNIKCIKNIIFSIGKMRPRQVR